MTETNDAFAPRWAIGLMSGTSLDGIDVALLRTDGERVVEAGPGMTHAYSADFRARLRSQLGKREADPAIVEELTHQHADAVLALLRASGVKAEDVAVVGFHGQTIWHEPEAQLTVQVGDGALLAALTGCDVVNQFRIDDVAAGGEGAPLVPVFHAAIAPDRQQPVAFLNIGGVSNLTWLGAIERDGSAAGPLAYDLGPGNALLDVWILRETGEPFDRDGALASKGEVDERRVDRLMAHEYFDRPFPKSLDRDAFNALPVIEGLEVADGAATLAAFTVEAIAAGAALLPERPARWLVCGGGRHNAALMRMLSERLRRPVDPVENIGWNGDLIEAQAFAYMAVRHLRDLPITFPGTTGVEAPLTGGRFHARPPT